MSAGVGLFGGSFDPIHVGHLIAARAVAEEIGLSRVILIPSAHPPHKRSGDLAAADHRLAMTRLAVADEPGFEVSDVELQREGPSYTIDTVESFRRTLGSEAELHWIIGSDSLPELPTWHRVDELVDLCAIVTATRPGYETPDLTHLTGPLSPAQVQRLRDTLCATPRIDVAATGIRDRVRCGRSIRYLVPEAVRDYIEQHGLYRG